MLRKAANGATLLTEIAPWLEGGEWHGETRLDRLAEALLAWDAGTVSASDLAREGDPMAMLEYGITDGRSLGERLWDAASLPYREAVAALCSGSYARNTVIAWRELLFLALANGGDEWAVLAWRPTERRLVAVEVISARPFFAPRRPDGRRGSGPDDDGYLWAGYRITALRAAAWLAAGVSPADGAPTQPSATSTAPEHAERLLARAGIVAYHELPLNGKGGST